MMSAMEFTHDMTYDAAPEEVVAMLADRAFREKVCDAMGSTRSDVTIDGAAGDGMRVVVDQTRPAAGIPSFARTFVGDAVRIVQRETWESATAAGLVVEIPGKPGSLDGAIRLSADGQHGAGTVETVSGDLKVKIPMVGGKLEALLADMLRKALRTEERVGRAWLAGDRG
jgi:uncharacterized protein DUF2505